MEYPADKEYQTPHGVMVLSPGGNVDYLDGRENGPAFVEASGFISFEVGGTAHHTAGPSMYICARGNVYYHLHHEEVSKEEFCKKVLRMSVTSRKKDSSHG